MELNILRIAATIISFILFVGIVVWAWRMRKTTDFKEAAHIPFDED